MSKLWLSEGRLGINIRAGDGVNPAAFFLSIWTYCEIPRDLSIRMWNEEREKVVLCAIVVSEGLPSINTRAGDGVNLVAFFLPTWSYCAIPGHIGIRIRNEEIRTIFTPCYVRCLFSYHRCFPTTAVSLSQLFPYKVNM